MGGKTMKKLCVFVMLLAVILGSVGCGMNREDETVYALTVQREYNSANEVIELRQYRYDSQGKLQFWSKDLGQGVDYFDEEQGIWLFKAGPVDGEIDRLVELEYDDGGNVVLRKEMWEDSSYQQECDWEYIETSGGKVPVKCSTSDDSYSLDYDQAGRLHTVNHTMNGREMCQLQLDYDEQNRLVREEIKQDGYNFIYEFTYNKNDQVKTYTLSGDSEEKLIFEYSKQGDLLSVKNENGIDRASYTYDKEGKMVCKEVYDEESAEKTVYTFHYDGNQIASAEAVVLNSAGKQTDSWECRYDPNGCLVEKRNEDGSRIEYEYQKLTLTAQQMKAYCRQQQITNGTHWQDWLFQGDGTNVSTHFPIPAHPMLNAGPETA